MKLLDDSEAEVRTIAASRIKDVSKCFSRDTVLSFFVPRIQDLCADESDHVRVAIAGVCMGLCPVLGKEHTEKYLAPLFDQLLKDANPDVRLEIVSKLREAENVIEIKFLVAALLPAVVELSADANWRVRAQVINNIPILAEELGADFFDKNLNTLCMDW